MLYNPLEIKTVFNTQVDLMLSVGALSGIPSSIVDLGGDEPEIIREGAGDLSYFY